MGEEPNSKQRYSCIRKTPWQSKSPINSVLLSCHATEEISSRHNHYAYKLLFSRHFNIWIHPHSHSKWVLLNRGNLVFPSRGHLSMLEGSLGCSKGCCGHLFVLYKDTSKYRTMFETAFTFHKKEQPGPNVSGTADETSNQSVHSAWAAEGLQKPSTVLAIDMWKYEGLYSHLTKTSGTKLQATTRKKSLSKRCA